MVKRFLVTLIFLAMILSTPSLVNAAYFSIVEECLWTCHYCEKKFITRRYDHPKNHGLAYGCPKNKVDGEHSWYFEGVLITYVPVE